MTSSKFKQVLKDGCRIAIAAGAMTLAISGLIRISNLVTGFDIPPGVAVTVIPIVIVLEIAGSRKSGERSLVLGRTVGR